MSQIELSASKRAGCRHCRKRIAKGTYRIGVTVDTSKITRLGLLVGTSWYHVKCYVNASDVIIPATANALSGYEQLSASEQARVLAVVWPNQASDKDKPSLRWM